MTLDDDTLSRTRCVGQWTTPDEVLAVDGAGFLRNCGNIVARIDPTDTGGRYWELPKRSCGTDKDADISPPADIAAVERPAAVLAPCIKRSRDDDRLMFLAVMG